MASITDNIHIYGKPQSQVPASKNGASSRLDFLRNLLPRFAATTGEAQQTATGYPPSQQIQAMDSITKRVFASLNLGAVGDTLGFGSGCGEKGFLGLDAGWELCGSTSHMQGILDSKFSGDYRTIAFRDGDQQQTWVISDDTILHLTHAEAAVSAHEKKSSPTPDEVVQEMAEFQVPALQYHTLTNARCFGNSTQRTYNQFKKAPREWKQHITGNPEATGCAGSMRGMIHGLLFPGDQHRDELVSSAFQASLLTNPSLTSAFGTLATAGFTSFAFEDLPIQQWMPQLQSLFAHLKRHISELQRQDNAPHFQAILKQCLEPSEWGHLLRTWDFYSNQIGTDQTRIPPREAFPKTPADRDELHRKIEAQANGHDSEREMLTNGDRADTAVMLSFHGLLSAIRLLLDLSKDRIPDSFAGKPSELRDLFGHLSEEKKRKVVDELVQFTVFQGGDCDSTGGIAFSLFGSIFGTDGVETKHVLENEAMPYVLDLSRKVAKITDRALHSRD